VSKVEGNGVMVQTLFLLAVNRASRSRFAVINCSCAFGLTRRHFTMLSAVINSGCGVGGLSHAQLSARIEGP
jgi:hypothetical protein